MRTVDDRMRHCAPTHISYAQHAHRHRETGPGAPEARIWAGTLPVAMPAHNHRHFRGAAEIPAKTSHTGRDATGREIAGTPVGTPLGHKPEC